MNVEPSPSTLSTVRSPHRAGQIAADRETKAGAFGRAGIAGVHAYERRENLVALFARDAGASVAHVERAPSSAAATVTRIVPGLGDT